MPETPDWSAPLQAPVTSLTQQALDATEGGASQVVLSAVPGRRIIVVQLVASAYASGFALNNLRDWVTLVLTNGATGDVIARTAISPAQPLGVAPILYGQAATDENTALWATASTRKGSGTQSILYDIAYYLGD